MPVPRLRGGVGIWLLLRLFFLPGRSFALNVPLYGMAGDKQGLCDLKPVQSVDLERFMGQWYEVGRMDSRFQSGQVGNTGHYTLVRKGQDCLIHAAYTYRKKSLTAREVQYRAKAWPIPMESHKDAVWWFSPMSFVQFRWVIIGLDSEYQWCVAGNPRRQNLWVMSRTPNMSPELWNHVLKIAHVNGFDVQCIRRTLQPRQRLTNSPASSPSEGALPQRPPFQPAQGPGATLVVACCSLIPGRLSPMCQ